MSQRTWIAGEVVTAAEMNTEVRDNVNAIRNGGLTIASQSALDFLYASSSSQLARLAAGSARQRPRINAAGSAWEFGDDTVALLKTGKGTDTNAAATNVDSVAISGLTEYDTLRVILTMGSTTQLTATPQLYNVTDSVGLFTAPANVNPGTLVQIELVVGQRQTSNVKVITSGHYGNDAVSGVPWSTNRTTEATFSTAWTGSWTLALRHNGVTAGGTFDYRWRVYRIAGQ